MFTCTRSSIGSIVIVVGVLAICSGQMCTPVGLINGATSSLIMPGIYRSGQNTCHSSSSITDTYLGVTDTFEDTTTMPATLIFAESGLPVEDGRTIFVGHRAQVTLGGMTIEMVVTSITATVDGLAVSYDITWGFDDGTGFVIDLTGVWMDVYELITTNTLRYASVGFMAFTNEYGTAQLTIDCEGIFTQ